MKKTIINLAAALAVAVSAQAAEIIKPQIDEPLRDPAVSRGPDGAYYLTGTLSFEASETPLDFKNNAGVKLWKSKDLKTWESLGWALHLPTHWDGNPGIDRTLTAVFVPDGQIDAYQAFGMTQPEIHYLKDTWWIAYSQNGRVASLLRSTSGKPEGPYEIHVDALSEGFSPSLFQDDDGTVYWITRGGWIAPMNADFKSLVAAPRPVTVAGDRDTVGTDGAFVVKHGGRYHLYATDIEMVDGKPGRHVYVADAADIFGPYENRRRVIDHAEQVAVFPWAKAGEVLASFHSRRPGAEGLTIAPLPVKP